MVPREENIFKWKYHDFKHNLYDWIVKIFIRMQEMYKANKH